MFQSKAKKAAKKKAKEEREAAIRNAQQVRERGREREREREEEREREKKKALAKENPMYEDHNPLYERHDPMYEDDDPLYDRRDAFGEGIYAEPRDDEYPGGYGTVGVSSDDEEDAAQIARNADGGPKLTSDISSRVRPPTPPKPTARNTALVQQAANNERILASLTATTKTTAPLNVATLTLCGAGGTGKTSACLAIQGKPLPAERESTRGGEGMALVVRMKKKELVGFEAPREDLSQLQRTLLAQLRSGQVDSDDDRDALSRFVTSPEAHKHMVRLQADLEAMGGSLTAVEVAEASEAIASARVEYHDDAARAANVSLPHGGFDAASSSKNLRSKLRAPKLRLQCATDVRVEVVPEQIHAKREAAVILRAQETSEGAAIQDGIHTLIYDLGGQPEFWPLVGEFLRDKSIITVFGRLDELAANVTRDKSIASDSSMRGFDELLLWLDAVAARTATGHVLLVLSHADNVPSESDRRAVSDAIGRVLRERAHPTLTRLVRPESGLFFYALDNRKGLDDAGVVEYRDKLRQLCEASESAKQRVPLDLLRLYDAMNALQREPRSEDPQAVGVIRASRETVGHVPYITLAEAALLFSSLTGRNVTEDLEDKEFRVYLDFLHLLGAITHSNAAGLDDIVVIDPFWLLQQETAIVRRPTLHPLAMDAVIAADLFESLYDSGILLTDIVAQLWAEHDPTLRLQLLGLMLQADVVVPLEQGEGQMVFIVPALLPETVPRAPSQGTVAPVVVYLACYTGVRLLNHNGASREKISKRCTLPVGLFEQLLAGLVKHGNDSRMTAYQPLLSRRYGFLLLGRYRLELEVDEKLRLVTFKFYVENAVGLLQQVVMVIKRTLERRFGSLHYELLVPADAFEPGCVVQVKALQEFHRTPGEQVFAIMQKLVPRADVEAKFNALLPVRNHGDVYHAFISYRQGPDSERASCLVNALSTLNFGDTGKTMNIFFDNFSLKDGQPFDETFMRGLARSLVAVPFVTADALARMCEPSSGSRVDNVLLEWWLALTLVKTSDTPLRYILPIFCGEIAPDRSGHPVVADLFRSFDFDQLPDTVHQPTYNRLCAFLRDDLKRGDIVPAAQTVRQVVDAIMKFNTKNTLCWLLASSGSAYADPLAEFGLTQRVFARCAPAVLAQVEIAVKESASPAVGNSQAAVSSAAVSAAASAGSDLAQWLAAKKFVQFEAPLQTLGVFVLDDLVFGVKEGDISADALVDAGVASRLQARRLLATVGTDFPR